MSAATAVPCGFYRGFAQAADWRFWSGMAKAGAWVFFHALLPGLSHALGHAPGRLLGARLG